MRCVDDNEESLSEQRSDIAVVKYWSLDGGKSVGAFVMFKMEGKGPCAFMTVAVTNLAICLLCDMSKTEAGGLRSLSSHQYFPDTDKHIF